MSETWDIRPLGERSVEIAKERGALVLPTCPHCGGVVMEGEVFVLPSKTYDRIEWLRPQPKDKGNG